MVHFKYCNMKYCRFWIRWRVFDKRLKAPVQTPPLLHTLMYLYEIGNCLWSTLITTEYFFISSEHSPTELFTLTLRLFYQLNCCNSFDLPLLSIIIDRMSKVTPNSFIAPVLFLSSWRQFPTKRAVDQMKLLICHLFFMSLRQCAQNRMLGSSNVWS